MLNSIKNAIENNDLELALTLLEKYEKEHEEVSEICNIKGILAIKAKEYDIAIECLKRGIELDSSNLDLYYNLGYCYEQLGDLQEALKQYNIMLELTPKEREKKLLYEIIAEIQQKASEMQQDIVIEDTRNKIIPQMDEEVFCRRKRMADILVEEQCPLVSVVVLAYNNLMQYTKTCVECILNYTKDIDYELILINNGSTDKTLEYFKTICHPNKKIVHITKNIGAAYGFYESYKYARGRYVVFVPNDIYVTRNWLKNMLTCIMSDVRIGMVNPVSDYVSNLQSVDLGYKNFDDMQVKAASYNISDPSKWEERLRLITLCTLYSKECIDMIGFTDYGFIHDFVDDDITFRARRAGYKTILCRDTFVCHAGKITDKGQVVMEQSLHKGRVTFQEKYYGIDAWEDVNNYETGLLNLLDLKTINETDEIKVLGIDVRCGTPVLELKNKLKYAQIFNPQLYAFTTDAKYWIDLKTICQGEVVSDRIEYIDEYFKDDIFDYILIGECLDIYKNPYKLLDDTLEKLKESGHLLMKISNNYDIANLLHILGVKVNGKGKDNVLIDINVLNQYLLTKGYRINKICGEQHIADDKIKDFIGNIVQGICQLAKQEEVIRELMIKEYKIDIVRCS